MKLASYLVSKWVEKLSQIKFLVDYYIAGASKAPGSKKSLYILELIREAY